MTTTLNSRQQLQVFFASLVCTFLSLLPRFSGEYFKGKYLWAEDGAVFINQAQRLGIESIWTTYAGYLHVFMRIVAYLSNLFSLSETPTIFLTGWVVAFYIMMHSILYLLVSLRFSVPVASIAALLVAFQPNNGEVFFTLTNSQWILGVAAILMIVTCIHCNTTRTARCILPALCLTGPFCVLASPFIAIFQLYENKPFKLAFWLSVIPFVAIQCLTFLTNPRGAINTLSQDYMVRLKYFISYASFGAYTPLLFICAAIVWCTYFYSMRYRSDSSESAYRRDLALLLLFIGVINILVTYLPSANPMPFNDFGDLSGGYRYTWVPYSLIFISIAVMTHGSIAPQSIAFSLLAIICASHTLSVRWGDTNLQFAAFSSFSNYQSVEIPINPQWAVPSAWVINDLRKSGASPLSARHIIPDVNNTVSAGARVSSSEGAFKVLADTSDPMVVLKNKLSCEKANNVGVEISMARDSDGWLQLFWSPTGEFTEKSSLRRFYKSGGIVAQFAFANLSNGFELRLDPLEKPGTAEINDFKVYCLP